jgi:acyl dehydratase
MTIDPGSVGLSSEPRTVTWTERDTLLYSLGIGCGVDDLSFVTENSRDLPQRVLPTFAVIACDGNSLVARAGEINWSKLVHGAQSIRLHGALPPAGALSVVATIADVQDKGEGKNAVITIATRGTDQASGELVVETTSTLVIRGAGGFGGAPGEPKPPATAPDREPDVTASFVTTSAQPLLYRLSGDRNPLHSDPWFARERAGFPGPILHGLCTYGVVGRSLLAELCGDDPERFSAMACRFAAPVFPGELLTTSIWRSGSGQAVFVTRAARVDSADERTVLDGGTFAYTDA